MSFIPFGVWGGGFFNRVNIFIIAEITVHANLNFEQLRQRSLDRVINIACHRCSSTDLFCLFWIASTHLLFALLLPRFFSTMKPNATSDMSLTSLPGPESSATEDPQEDVMALDYMKDFKQGPLDNYRKRASFDWKRMRVFLDGEDVIRFKVSCLQIHSAVSVTVLVKLKD